MPRGSGCFLASGRDLLGQIGRRIDVLRVFRVEVGEEDDFKPSPQSGIVVHQFANGIDKLDDAGGHKAPGRGLAAKDKRARWLGPAHQCRIGCARQSSLDRRSRRD
jgi:hypothetical protein